MKLATAAPGDKFFDHYGDLTAAQCAALRADGFAGCFTYVEGLTPEQLAVRLNAGLLVSFLLEGLAKTTLPTRDLGSRMAGDASDSLRRLQVPQGVCVFADAESESGLGGAQAWKNFLWGTSTATIAAGDVPGGYIAEGVGLTSAELMALPIRRYWKGASRVEDASGALAEPSRGWCCYQLLPIDFPHPAGARIDLDACSQDRLGGNVIGVSL